MLARALQHGPASRLAIARLSTAAASLVDCSRVHVKPDAYGGCGAFAACDIRMGDLVERGIMRRLTKVDGNVNPYVYAWSDDAVTKRWAIGSGCATFYNTGPDPNAHMLRLFDQDRFEITALRDIKCGEELTIAYLNIQQRSCYDGLGIGWG